MYLTIDYRVTPTPFLVLGRQPAEITINCPGDEPLQTMVFLDWLIGSGFVSDDGMVIQEQQSNEVRNMFYRFTRR